uniref:Wzz n=1 Tax=Yersinia enterocolitica (type O:8) TaxID=34054 RepID=Q57210_YEREN|nr:Wzz [Yersinia enterocolitica (type O:8)]prf//2208415F O-antigen polymerase [Yersinia enterocolitica]
MSDRSQGNDKKPSPFGKYILPSNKEEVDLIEIISIIFRSSKLIFIVIAIFTLVGGGVVFFSPKEWTSYAIVSVTSDGKMQPLESIESSLSVLNIDLNITADDLLMDFRKYYSSKDMLSKYMSKEKVNANNFAGVKGKNINSDSDVKGNYILTYSSNLEYGLKDVFTGYVNYINRKVNDNLNDQIKFTIDTAKKMATEEYNLALQQVENEHKIRIQRLEYAASIAKAAGLQKPAIGAFDISASSNNYPISMGYDLLNRQLEIERSITDLTSVNADLLNKKLYLNKITALQPVVIDVPTFNYLQEPSDPLQHSVPSEPILQNSRKGLLTIISFSFIGLIGSITFVLMRFFVRERHNSRLEPPKK